MKIITHWALAFITAALLVFAHYNDSSVVQTIRLKQFDLLQQTDTPVTSTDIVVVEIDEQTIAEYGQWPWKRDVLAYFVWRYEKQALALLYCLCYSVKKID